MGRHELVPFTVCNWGNICSKTPQYDSYQIYTKYQQNDLLEEGSLKCLSTLLLDWLDDQIPKTGGPGVNKRQEVEPDNVLALSCYPGLKEDGVSHGKNVDVLWQ